MISIAIVFVNIIIIYAVLNYVKPSGKLINNPFALLIIWILLFTFEYFIFGKFSFIYIGDEGELLVPAYHFMSERWDGGQYIHGLASGSDARAGFIVGGELFSIDRLLFNLFPVWLAIFIHKVLVVSFGFAGTYLLCRQGLGTRKVIAASAGALFTVGYFRFVNVTLGSGFGLILMPMAMYALVYCHGHKHYLSIAFLCAVLLSIVIVPTQSALPLGAALISAMVLFRKFSPSVFVVIAFVFFGIAFNWSESLFGMIQLGPHRYGGQVVIPSDLWSAIQIAAELYSAHLGLAGRNMGLGMTVIVCSWLIASMVLIALRDKLTLRFALAFFAPFATVVIFLVLPWEILHLEVIRGVTLNYIGLALLPSGVIALAYAVNLALDYFSQSKKGTQAITLFSLAAPIGVLSWYKIFALWQLLTVSGQGMYWTVENLKDQSWRSTDLSRSISLQQTNLIPKPNLLFSFYNIDMFDAFRNFPSNAYFSYWQNGISPNGTAWNNSIWLQPKFFDMKQKNYNVSAQADLTLLGAANIRYIYSPVPLKEDGLQLVDGPAFNEKLFKVAAQPLAQSAGGSQWEKLTQAAAYASILKDRGFSYGKVYIYELDKVMPRAWMARNVVEVPDGVSEKNYLARVRDLVFSNQGIVRAKDIIPELLNVRHDEKAKVVNVKIVKNGYDIKLDAPDGGLVVVNAEMSPFFVATVNGQKASIMSVNSVQTGIVVPVGGRVVSLRYSRPSIWDSP